jgi:hypothetical protein
MEIQIPDWSGAPLYTVRTLSTDTIMLTVHGYEGDTVWKYFNSLADLLEKNFAAGAGYYLIIDMTVPEKSMMLPFDSEVTLIKDDVLRRILAFRRLATLVIINEKGILFQKNGKLSQMIGEQIPYVAVKSFDDALSWIRTDRDKENR